MLCLALPAALCCELHSVAGQLRARQGKAWHGTTRYVKTRKDKGKRNKARQDKTGCKGEGVNFSPADLSCVKARHGTKRLPLNHLSLRMLVFLWFPLLSSVFFSLRLISVGLLNAKKASQCGRDKATRQCRPFYRCPLLHRLSFLLSLSGTFWTLIIILDRMSLA